MSRPKFADDEILRAYLTYIQEMNPVNMDDPSKAVLDPRAWMMKVNQGVPYWKILKEGRAGKHTQPHGGYENNSGYTELQDERLDAMAKIRRVLGAF